MDIYSDHHMFLLLLGAALYVSGFLVTVAPIVLLPLGIHFFRRKAKTQATVRLGAIMIGLGVLCLVGVWVWREATREGLVDWPYLLF